MIPDQVADDAARKISDSAKIRDKEHPSETEKATIASSDFEAHSELERPEHNRGHPA
jgi:hypothetical protein